jgi:very-short-patch-repair endonuclease
MVKTAQRLRRNPTAQELKFWALLHPVRTQWHFRKQVRMGRYVVDSASHKAKLVVEVDGETHFVGSGPAKDAERDANLAAYGYRVLRLTNDEVMSNPEGVYLAVVAALAEKAPPPEQR